MKLFWILFFICFTEILNGQTIDSSDYDTMLFRKCSLSKSDVEFVIDSCNCDDIKTNWDTIFIDIFPEMGGEILGKLLKINFPVCDSNFYIIKSHQNRFYTSSMGPDPVYVDWLLYNSPKDTLKFDVKRNGFYIDNVLNEDSISFPKFEPLEFYKEYRRYFSDGKLQNISDKRLRKDYLKDKEKIDDILERSDIELHRVILDLRKKEFRVKIFVFTYAHFG